MTAETAQQAARRLLAPQLGNGYKLTAAHKYTDPAGALLFYRLRAEHPQSEKYIRPMHINGNGWQLGEPKFPTGKPLYGLHRLAQRLADLVIVTEGEKAADALNAWADRFSAAITATTSGSSSSAKGADWSSLRSRHVLIWPDNDVPGIRYGQDVAEALGRNTDIIDAHRLGMDSGGDAFNWLAAHPDATDADLQKLPRVSSSARWRPAETFGDAFEPQPYPIDALPVSVRAAVIEVQAFVQAPIALVASSALGALSTAAQAYADVARDAMLCGPISLYLLTLGEPGERKSEVDRLFRKPLQEWEASQRDAQKIKDAEHRAEVASWEAQRDTARAALKDKSRKADAEDELQHIEERKPQEPKKPRLILGDVTPEAIAAHLAKHWPAGGIMSAEAGGIFGGHLMSADVVMRTLALLNALWSGEPHIVDRRTSEHLAVTSARFSVALMIQPEVLRHFAEKHGALARGSGFFARFLIAWPETTQGRRPYREPAASWPALGRYCARLRAILDQPAPLNDDGQLAPVQLLLTPAAKAAWVRVHDELESLLAPGAEFEAMKDSAGKAAENVARVAALFHMFEHGTTGTAPISAEHIEGAARIVCWHIHEARRVFGEIVTEPVVADAHRLDTWLAQTASVQGQSKISRREAQRRGPVRTPERLAAALRELEDMRRWRTIRDGKTLLIEMNPSVGCRL